MKIIKRKDISDNWYLSEKLVGKRTKWICVLFSGKDTPIFKTSPDNGKDIFYHDGWNNSFHDSRYWSENAFLIVTGNNPGRCRKKALNLLSNLSEQKDSGSERLYLRSLVRTGD